ncbi:MULTISPECIES: monovalent cation/H+ antiporter subunit D [unclassified Aminobacter]|uniref:monovalent cation/H+ antiporter subunit D n=1 Tax=unclassified Aminobacter TaxID=2644704 RepID=UPI000466E1BB|nr:MULTISPECIES: monovalent cation/H+ antiporter subunit D [unclassified Aminobacter]TWH33527.1 multisubunit potassium/proton antiporter PhaD subunit [Aminobacter sp. J15]
MIPAPEHLVILPIVLPLVAGALLLFFNDQERVLKATITIGTAVALLIVAILLLRIAHADGRPGGGRVVVYLLGNWPPPFAIVLVLDRLAAMMLALTAVLAIPALVFSIVRWQKAGPNYHTLFLFLLMGLNGSFLTGDLFNLFVFFEVMLAASYGLVLHSSGSLRVRAGLHYIAINLAASLLFLIGVAMIYGVTGTLNMADLALRIPKVAPESMMMLEAGAGILGIAFLIKAGMWPLSFWLPTTYTAAPAPVAAIMAIMSKVGVYVILRLSLLFFTKETVSFGFGTNVLLLGGILTITFGAIGVLASQSLGRLAGFSVLVSSGTLLASLGLFEVGVTAGALLYLVSSTIAISAFFLLIELVERGQDQFANVLAVTVEAFGEGEEDEDVEEEVGVTIPGTLAILGISFGACALLLAGLPPLPGFVAKFIIIDASFNHGALGDTATIPSAAWWLATFLVLSGLASLISMSRAGIRTFWAPVDVVIPRVQLMEIIPIGVLLALTLALTVQAGPIMRFMQATADNLHDPRIYIESVVDAPRSVPRGREATR